MSITKERSASRRIRPTKSISKEIGNLATFRMRPLLISLDFFSISFDRQCVNAVCQSVRQLESILENSLGEYSLESIRWRVIAIRAHIVLGLI